jgi:predicted dithiol-disulfide oxidoreductase (DUF899 family)
MTQTTTERPIGTRAEWLEARLALLESEKELTRLNDELARRRLALPRVPVDKDYVFVTEEGEAALADLFGGRSQLLVYHFMFGPDWTEGCPSCSSIADGFEGIRVHLENHDVALVAVSRGPIEALLAYRARMGWTFPWASALDSEFNFDFGVSFSEEQVRNGVDYNFRHLSPADSANLSSEAPGVSAFLLDDGVVYHTYSAYSRGFDALWGMHQWLDRAPFGRNETTAYWCRHDEYGR